MTIKLHLLSTLHCHLCEDAILLLELINSDQEIEWDVIEITDDETLLITYGNFIPVIKRNDTNAVLKWPFSRRDIEQFIT